MKLWAIAGLFASAALVSVLFRHRGHKPIPPPSDSDCRYSIDELITDPES